MVMFLERGCKTWSLSPGPSGGCLMEDARLTVFRTISYKFFKDKKKLRRPTKYN